jgi:PAS domain-containing protein
MSWSVRRIATWALSVALAGMLPLAGVVYWRLFTMQSEERLWAELAQASRWLSVGTTCGGSDSAAQAREDLVRWKGALAQLNEGAARWFQSAHLVRRLAVLEDDVTASLRGPDSQAAAWVRARCDDFAHVSALALDESIRLGTEPASRVYRLEDVALRDVTTYLVVWVTLMIGLVAWMRRAIVQPAMRLSRVLTRIADGDLSAEVPTTHGGEMLELAQSIKLAVERFEQRDLLKIRKIIEVRDLVRRLLEVLEQPVLVIGLDRKVDYANSAAARAFDEKLDTLEGMELTRLPGGEAVINAMDDIVQHGEVVSDRLLSTNPLRQDQHLAHCAVVRDRDGNPSRVIMVLKSAEGAWWKRLFRASETDAESA